MMCGRYSLFSLFDIDDDVEEEEDEYSPRSEEGGRRREEGGRRIEEELGWEERENECNLGSVWGEGMYGGRHVCATDV